MPLCCVIGFEVYGKKIFSILGKKESLAIKSTERCPLVRGSITYTVLYCQDFVLSRGVSSLESVL